MKYKVESNWDFFGNLKIDEVPTIHCVNSFDEKFSFRIDKPEWVNNLEGEQPLPDKFAVDDLIKILKEKIKDKDYGGVNTWEYARRTWNINHPDKKVLSKKMPNYKLLKKEILDENFGKSNKKRIP